MQPQSQSASREPKAGQGPRAAALILPGHMDAAELEGMAAALGTIGVAVHVHANRSLRPRARTLLTQAEAARLEIRERHGSIPVFLLGHGHDAALAAALLHRLPGQFAGAVLAEAAWFTAVQRAVYLLMLRWERFRLGSDVPSRILRSEQHSSPTVGQGIARIELGRWLAPDHLRQLSERLPILVLPSQTANDPFFRNGFLNPVPKTWAGKRNLLLKDLNQNVKKGVSAWISLVLAELVEDGKLA